MDKKKVFPQFLNSAFNLSLPFLHQPTFIQYRHIMGLDTTVFWNRAVLAQTHKLNLWRHPAISESRHIKLSNYCHPLMMTITLMILTWVSLDDEIQPTAAEDQLACDDQEDVIDLNGASAHKRRFEAWSESRRVTSSKTHEETASS